MKSKRKYHVNPIIAVKDGIINCFEYCVNDWDTREKIIFGGTCAALLAGAATMYIIPKKEGQFLEIF